MSQHVMGSAEGAAIRVQLDGMIATLEGFRDAAGQVDDRPVVRLLIGLYAARNAAQVIEDRTQHVPAAMPEVKTYQGVRLAKY